MFVYFGVEMNNECKISELQWVLFIFYHKKYTYRKCLFFCSDSSVCHSNCLTTSTKDHERDVFQFAFVGKQMLCHSQPSIHSLARLIHNLKLRIILVPLHRCFISGGSTKGHRQNCLCTQPIRRRKHVMTNNYLRYVAATGNNGFSLANHVVNGFDARPICKENAFTK